MSTGTERPWLRHYAEGVAADVDLPRGSLVDLLETAVTRFGDKVALEFFGAEADLHRAGRQVDLAAEGLRRLGSPRGTGWRWCCPTAPSTSSRSTRCSGSARSSSSTTRSTPRRELRPPVRRPRGDRGRGVGQGRPAGRRRCPAVQHVIAVDITASHAVAPSGLPCACRSRRARTAREQPDQPRPGSDARGPTCSRHGPLTTSTPRPTADDLAADPVHERHDRPTQGRPLTHRNLGPTRRRAAPGCPGLRTGEEVVYCGAADVPRLRR